MVYVVLIYYRWVPPHRCIIIIYYPTIPYYPIYDNLLTDDIIIHLLGALKTAMVSTHVNHGLQVHTSTF